ncbi:type II toxin-antitoxin system HicB family antitoxin [Phenylobacterium sp.]|uniref:type II toxin-antitoxin system HicB family antitoxin n=1 Tax=Phenylobacterium sp. TaxID=1871053 RepID=UPI002FD92425
MRYHTALIHKDPDSDYGVYFPDFPACVTASATLGEAAAMARAALDGHVSVIRGDSDAIPTPSTMDQVMAVTEARDGMPLLVSLASAGPPRVAQVNIALPEDLLQEIDRTAEARGYTRSGFLAEGARRLLTDA